MDGYKRILKYSSIYIWLFFDILIFLFYGILGELVRDEPQSSAFWVIFVFSLIMYISWIAIYLVIFGSYTLFLLLHKISFNIKQTFKKITKKLKIRRKRIWKYPIIIQFTPPEWLSVNEISYIYDMKHFKSNIICLFYKRAYEKRISMTFKKWNILTFDKVEINIMNDSLEDMPIDEVQQRKLIFNENKSITLPNVYMLRKISDINIYTAHTCYEKKLIKKWISITVTPKAIERVFVTLWIISIIFLILYSYVYPNFSGRTMIPIITFAIFMIFWADETKYIKKTKFTHYTLSEKWKKILAEIYWYKYFLESCDEKKIRTFLKEDPNYLDKIMPYAITMWVESEIIKKVAPKIFDWTENNWYGWDLYSIEKTLLLSSERTLLVSSETSSETLWKNVTILTNKEKVKEKKEYKTTFSFLKVWKLLSKKERIWNIKNLCSLLCFIFVWMLFIWLVPANLKKFYNFLIIWFCFAVAWVFFIIKRLKKFEEILYNNKVYLWGTCYYFSSINNIDYCYIVENGIEWLMLTLEKCTNKWKSHTKVYKRPKEPEVEQFCKDLIDAVKKSKKEKLK